MAGIASEAIRLGIEINLVPSSLLKIPSIGLLKVEERKNLLVTGHEDVIVYSQDDKVVVLKLWTDRSHLKITQNSLPPAQFHD